MIFRSLNDLLLIFRPIEKETNRLPIGGLVNPEYLPTGYLIYPSDAWIRHSHLKYCPHGT